MKQKGLLKPGDIKGAWSIVPTPAKLGASDWRAIDTVDLDETARVVEGLIDAGINGLLSMGSLGECATLTWEEKKAFMATLVETARGRIPVFVGTTTRQTIDGPLAIADFERPNSCAFTPDGTILYVMDRDNGLLRKIDAGKP